MEDTVKALEEKVALLEAKLGKKSESKAGASSSSPTTSPENPLRIKPESLSATSGESWVVWIRKFKSIAALNKWSPELQCQNITRVPERRCRTDLLQPDRRTNSHVDGR